MSEFQKKTRIEQCKLIDLPVITDSRGNLTFVESNRHIPFKIKRVYYLYDVPNGSTRAGHGHKMLHQLVIAMSGSFDIVIDDGFQKKRFHLNRSSQGLYLCPMMWRVIDNFSGISVCMVLASDYFDEADYFREYPEFLRTAREQQKE